MQIAFQKTIVFLVFVLNIKLETGPENKGPQRNFKFSKFEPLTSVSKHEVAGSNPVLGNPTMLHITQKIVRYNTNIAQEVEIQEMQARKNKNG